MQSRKCTKNIRLAGPTVCKINCWQIHTHTNARSPTNLHLLDIMTAFTHGVLILNWCADIYKCIEVKEDTSEGLSILFLELTQSNKFTLAVKSDIKHIPCLTECVYCRLLTDVNNESNMQFVNLDSLYQWRYSVDEMPLKNSKKLISFCWCISVYTQFNYLCPSHVSSFIQTNIKKQHVSVVQACMHLMHVSSCQVDRFNVFVWRITYTFDFPVLDSNAAFTTQLVFVSLRSLLTQQCFYHVVFISWNYPWLLSSVGKTHQEAFWLDGVVRQFLWHSSCSWRALGTVKRKQPPWEWIQTQSLESSE